MRLKTKLSIVLLVALFCLIPARANAATVSDISEQLICQCGCTLVLSNCTHHECASREAMTTLIKQNIAQGQSGEQIIQSFVVQYGEQVLSAPPKQGFNLTAWVLPFAALLLGGWMVYLALRVWVRRGKQYQTSAVAKAEEGDEKYQQQLKKELETFAERGFR